MVKKLKFDFVISTFFRIFAKNISIMDVKIKKILKTYLDNHSSITLIQEVKENDKNEEITRYIYENGDEDIKEGDFIPHMFIEDVFHALLADNSYFRRCYENNEFNSHFDKLWEYLPSFDYHGDEVLNIWDIKDKELRYVLAKTLAESDESNIECARIYNFRDVLILDNSIDERYVNVLKNCYYPKSISIMKNNESQQTFSC